ncbi:hypothetical protein E4U21_002041 [Claviceps maximensis]|nr:hypothetical protein E4U21_002041 [Claviceps maximensis]
MDNNISRDDLMELYLQERRLRERAEGELKRAEELRRKSTFMEFLHHCHALFSVPLTVDSPRNCTTGKIPLPKDKFCPLRMELWEDCPAKYQQIFDSVCQYLQPANKDAPRLFASQDHLEFASRTCLKDSLNSENALASYDRSAVNDRVEEIIAELCKIPAAKQEFGLGTKLLFDSYTNTLEKTKITDSETKQISSHPRSASNNYCINVQDDNTKVLLTFTEYKPPHKLPTAAIHLGLRPMDLLQDMVHCETTPTEAVEKQKFDAERVACFAIVQQHHVMIQEGLEVSCLTNGFCEIHLRVPCQDLRILQYYVFEPNADMDTENADYPRSLTKVARRLCLYLSCHGYKLRNQEWRNAAEETLRTFQAGFDDKPHQTPVARPDDASSHSQSSDSSHSEYQASPRRDEGSSAAGLRRLSTRAQGGCAPQEARQHTESPKSGSDTAAVEAQRKRRNSQVSPWLYSPARNDHISRGNSSSHHDAKFCTLNCLLGLQRQSAFDEKCPNIKNHQRNGNATKHSMDGKQLVQSLREQLKLDLDHNFTPFGQCGQSGAPFKLTCTAYGYTVVAKGTTTDWWPEVAREADVYQILRKAQASAVPVFLGTIDMVKPYFLHGAGSIRHLLVMGWGGERIDDFSDRLVWSEFQRSEREIRRLGVNHLDLEPQNVLWNEEVRRVLIIDFHHAKLIPPRLMKTRRRKRLVEREEVREEKGTRITKLGQYP